MANTHSSPMLKSGKPACSYTLYLCYDKSISKKHIHRSRNIKHFREMLGMKQEAIAIELRDNWTQKKVSLLEAKEAIDAPLLERVASILKVPKEAIENMDDEGAINIIANTFNADNSSVAFSINTEVNTTEK